MKQVIYPTSPVVSPLREGASFTSTSGVRAIPWVLVLITALAWLYATSAGVSWTLAQGLGVSILLSLGLPLAAAGVIRRPETIARPIHVFFLGCIYFFVLDMAFLRKVEEFQPETVLIAETVIVLFLVVVIGTWCLVPLRNTPLATVLRQVDGSLRGNTYFWVALVAFSLEYLRRLSLVGWSFSDLVHELFLSKTGEALQRDVAGDWRVFLQPIEVLFWGVAVFADREWKRGISTPRKLILLVVVALQLGTLVLDGARGKLLIAMMLPLFVRGSQHDQAMARWLRVFVLASFLLAPVMDMMLGGRTYGWSEISRVERISWNIVEAHRDDNFFRVVNLVNFLRQDHGILGHKGPLGFIEGMREVGWLWLIAPIPRVFWPNKPLATEMGDETRAWYVTDSIVGDLLRSGGVTFVVLGGILFGLWLRLLEPLYPLQKGDGAAIAYAFLLVITLAGIRSAIPWNTIPLLLIFLLVVIGWGAVRVLRRLSAPLTLRV